MKYKYSDFGKQVKIRLININKTQEWLISEINKDTGLFIDSSYLNRILTGRNNSNKIISSIKKILSIDCQKGDETDAKRLNEQVR